MAVEDFGKFVRADAAVIIMIAEDHVNRREVPQLTQKAQQMWQSIANVE